MFSGGSGILFTNERLNRLVNNFENKKCHKFIDSFGDITIGKCAHAVSISIGNSNDKKNKKKFHPFDYKRTYSEKGKSCCSLETISFHYTQIEDMYYIHANKTFLRDLLT